MKVCPRCHKRKRRNSGFQLCGKYTAAYCKLCSSLYSKERYIANGGKEKGRERYRKYRMRCLELQKVRRYGVDSLAIEKQAAKQRQRCAICRTKVPGGRYNKWHVDHKHGTKKMRGLLCNNCNTGIGFLKESLRVLKNAIKYLEKE